MQTPSQNLNMFDRVIRGILGVITVYLGIFGSELIGEPIVQGILIVFGVVNIISLAFGWCIVYSLAGISTCKKESA